MASTELHSSSFSSAGEVGTKYVNFRIDSIFLSCEIVLVTVERSTVMLLGKLHG